jgi:chemotaxis signal transduction protein
MMAVQSMAKVAKTNVKVIVFTIAGYRLALPMEAVLRVVNCPSEVSDRAQKVELIHLGQTAITVLNLHTHLSLKQVKPVAAKNSFLVAAKAGTELCAIRVDTPPDLIELDPTTIRQLPSPYQQGHPLSIASRVAVLPQGKATLAIFILDMKRVMDAIVKA